MNLPGVSDQHSTQLCNPRSIAACKSAHIRQIKSVLSLVCLSRPQCPHRDSPKNTLPGNVRPTSFSISLATGLSSSECFSRISIYSPGTKRSLAPEHSAVSDAPSNPAPPDTSSPSPVLLFEMEISPSRRPRKSFYATSVGSSVTYQPKHHSYKSEGSPL